MSEKKKKEKPFHYKNKKKELPSKGIPASVSADSAFSPISLCPWRTLPLGFKTPSLLL